MPAASRQVTLDRLKSAILTAFTADAVAMPVHWFYEPNTQIKEFCGVDRITGLLPAPPKHPYTFMKAPEPDESLGGKKLVGDVILKQAASRWGPPQQHVHAGLPAGENTLNAYLARLTLRNLAPAGRHDPQQWLLAFVQFMTSAEPTHPDTYAESFIRNFFLQWAKGVPPAQCADHSDGTNSIGGLVRLVPVALVELLHDRDVARVQKLVRQSLFLTAPHETLAAAADGLVALFAQLLFRPDDDTSDTAVVAALRSAASSAGLNIDDLLQNGASEDAKIVGGTFPTSCAIANSWPNVLFLATKYRNDPTAGLLANANLGGESCHRGFVLGSILGLLNGGTTPLAEGLLHRAEIVDEVEKCFASHH